MLTSEKTTLRLTIGILECYRRDHLLIFQSFKETSLCANTKNPNIFIALTSCSFSFSRTVTCAQTFSLLDNSSTGAYPRDALYLLFSNNACGNERANIFCRNCFLHISNTLRSNGDTIMTAFQDFCGKSFLYGESHPFVT